MGSWFYENFRVGKFSPVLGRVGGFYRRVSFQIQSREYSTQKGVAGEVQTNYVLASPFPLLLEPFGSSQLVGHG